MWLRRLLRRFGNEGLCLRRFFCFFGGIRFLYLVYLCCPCAGRQLLSLLAAKKVTKESGFNLRCRRAERYGIRPLSHHTTYARLRSTPVAQTDAPGEHYTEFPGPLDFGPGPKCCACGPIAQRRYAVGLSWPAPEVEAAFFSPLFFAAAKKRGCRPAQGQRVKQDDITRMPAQASAPNACAAKNQTF